MFIIPFLQVFCRTEKFQNNKVRKKTSCTFINIKTYVCIKTIKYVMSVWVKKEGMKELEALNDLIWFEPK